MWKNVLEYSLRIGNKYHCPLVQSDIRPFGAINQKEGYRGTISKYLQEARTVDNQAEKQIEGEIKKGGGKKVIIICAVVIVALLGVIVYLLTRKPAGEQPKERKSVVTADNAEEITDNLVNPAALTVPETYTVTQNAEWTFPDGTAASTDAYVANVEGNETPVYFDVVVDATGEMVYSSPVLELGASLQGFKLDKTLSAGSYPCTITYHLVDDEQNTLTTVNVGVTINVEK